VRQYGAPVRTEPTFCMMGAATGLMAGLIVNQNRAAQLVQYVDLQPLLSNARIS
jgi:hypothetical protein